MHFYAVACIECPENSWHDCSVFVVAFSVTLSVSVGLDRALSRENFDVLGAKIIELRETYTIKKALFIIPLLAIK